MKTHAYESRFASRATPEAASGMLAARVVLLRPGVACVLYRKRIFIKV